VVIVNPMNLKTFGYATQALEKPRVEQAAV